MIAKFAKDLEVQFLRVTREATPAMVVVTPGPARPGKGQARVIHLTTLINDRRAMIVNVRVDSIEPVVTQLLEWGVPVSNFRAPMVRDVNGNRV